jgi:hypothetical protein
MDRTLLRHVSARPRKVVGVDKRAKAPIDDPVTHSMAQDSSRRRMWRGTEAALARLFRSMPPDWELWCIQRTGFTLYTVLVVSPPSVDPGRLAQIEGTGDSLPSALSSAADRLDAFLKAAGSSWAAS